jgi:hypothetical protein
MGPSKKSQKANPQASLLGGIFAAGTVNRELSVVSKGSGSKNR